MMKWAVILALLFNGSCSRPAQVVDNISTPQSPSPTAIPTPISKSAGNATEEVPQQFAPIDFRNLAYRINWKNQLVHLKNGHAEFFEHKILGNSWFDLDDPHFVDLNGDGVKEAVVTLHWVACGASCDGGSFHFYFYQIKKRELRLLTKIETGSLAYQECGLKSFVLEGKKLVLESFQ